ncbi:MAG: demethylmenaquinone methyltransferase / 2-methoxy-6-polyprenyl-1,4-benzoquinol methylase [Candidatus Methanocomedens sp.]|jgi:demethylmenaquinone methyltransferase/2-methoxy-6-polyprenyl-1,4-benzoquinol methylase|nr:MAG: demethylmenaquinone methyltransferase / 2-methoxy-6-polyprenyl-1,4-benzoquinol methylase [ANME-2 cluster archaeon]
MSVLSKYDRISPIYDLMEAPVELFLFRKWRRAVLSDLHGSVLEVGTGTGKNLEYYPKDCKVTAIDISPKMLEHAKKRMAGMDNISLLVMDAELLAFADNSFDYVITTFVLCSIPNPVAALREMRRVCKPDGLVINLEHMRSSNRMLTFLENVLNPISVFFMGVNLNRKTVENIKKAGLSVVEEKHLALRDVFRLIRSKP